MFQYDIANIFENLTALGYYKEKNKYTSICDILQ